MTINPKVFSGAVAGSITVILFFLVSFFTKSDVPPAVSSAVTTVISALFGYFTSVPENGSGGSGNDGVPEKFL